MSFGPSKQKISTNHSQDGRKSKPKSKKRNYSDVFGQQKISEEEKIEHLLTEIKQRVLNQENRTALNGQINQIVDIIEKKDKNERLFEVVGNKLAEILQKSELEMQYMLKRTLLLKKKNQKKSELDKILQTVKNKIEGALKAQNQRFNAETVHLE